MQLEKAQHDHMNEREEKGELSWVGLSWVELGWVGVEQTLHIRPLPRQLAFRHGQATDGNDDGLP